MTIGLSTNGFSQKKKKTFWREKSRLTSPAVRAAATSKAFSSSSTRKQEEALLEEFYPGGEGVLPMMAYTGRLCPKERSFSGLRYLKG